MRERIYEIIFEADTPAGKVFDVALLVVIVASVFAVMLESVAGIASDYGAQLRAFEWLFTALFTIEYLLRLFSVRRPLRYALSFFGIVDLIAILPSYLSFFMGASPSLAVVRIMRLVRVFRVLKLARFLGEADTLRVALKGSVPKIIVFLVVVVCFVVIVGTAMYLIESPHNPHFSSIPTSVYWAIVTLTTVGYGDITPASSLGRVLASMLMVSGYAFIAVPTGIVASELVQVGPRRPTTQVCPGCLSEGHDVDAAYCKRCGEAM